MNKMICTFLALSLFSPLLLAKGNADYTMARNPNINVPTAKYNEGAGNDFDTWLSNIDNAVKPTIEARFEEIYTNSDTEFKLNAKAQNMLLNRMKEEQIADVWNKILQRYPNSKNARSALCRYAKEIWVLYADVKKCDKDFQLNPAKQFVYRRDLKALQAPKLD